MTVVREAWKRIDTLLLGLAFCAVWGYGATVTLNGMLDPGRPSVYQAKVLDKRVSHGKHTSYYLTLSPWGPVANPREFDVSRSIYDNRSTGDEVRAYLMQGAFHIPWYVIE